MRLRLAEVVAFDHGLLEIGVGADVVLGEVEAIVFVGVIGAEADGFFEGP